MNIKFKKNYAMAVNIINKNYPNLQKKEQAKINKNSIKELLSKDIQIFFYNNIKEDENFYIQNCDRFLSIVSSENNINSLQKKLYDKISKIEGENIFFRKDIGKLN